MASLYKRGNVYYAKFSDASRSPKQKQVSTKEKNKTAARAKVARWEQLYAAGKLDPWRGTDAMHTALRPDEPKGVPLAEAVRWFVERKQATRRAESTVRTYRKLLGRFAEHAGAESSTARLTAKKCRAFIHRGDVAASTEQKRFRHLRAFLNWAAKEDLLGSGSPLDRLESPKVSKKLPVAATEQEVGTITDSILHEAKQLRERNQIEEGQLVWRIYPIWFSFFTGLRRGEIARLKWKDVDLENQTLHLRTQKNKQEQHLAISGQAAKLLRRLCPEMQNLSQSSEGDVPLAYGDLDMMYEYMRSEPDEGEWFVFGSPSTRERTERKHESWCNDMSRAFTKYRKKCGLRDGLTFHSLRAGFCTALAKDGANAMTIKKLARHSSITTSMKYIQMNEDHGRGALESAFGEMAGF